MEDKAKCELCSGPIFLKNSRICAACIHEDHLDEMIADFKKNADLLDSDP